MTKMNLSVSKPTAIIPHNKQSKPLSIGVHFILVQHEVDDLLCRHQRGDPHGHLAAVGRSEE